MEKWHIGCSGFHYKHWRGTFYPEKLAVKNWFSYYTEHFDTLELNVTFYRFPTVPILTNWYEKSAAGFRFAVKAPRLITHYKKFTDSERLLDDFYRTVDLGLKEKCGCCLFQLPPAYHYTEERLEKIVNSLHPDFNNVMEFRHVSWWQEEVYQELTHRNISFCGMSHPDLPKDIIQNSQLLYFRFHGEAQLYASHYSDQQLQEFAAAITQSGNTKQGYIFFNNDINTNAVYNARTLKEILKNPNS
jgi:uncharacterized protein YecE (DUF72 family)